MDIADFTGELFSVTLQGPPRQAHFGVRQAAILVALCWNERKRLSNTHLDHTAVLPGVLAVQPPDHPAPC